MPSLTVSPYYYYYYFSNKTHAHPPLLFFPARTKKLPFSLSRSLSMYVSLSPLYIYIQRLEGKGENRRKKIVTETFYF
nr:hypothetical protein Itr_chr08CG00500 [Ipomoea trifida]